MEDLNYREQCRLEDAIRAAQKELDAGIQGGGTTDLVPLRNRVNQAHDALARWGGYILQVFSPPVGMVAVFEREDGLEEYIPVSYLGLTRAGRVLPYILQGNCESMVPSDYPNFLRIDFEQTMKNEVPFELLGTEAAPPAQKEARAAWPR